MATFNTIEDFELYLQNLSLEELIDIASNIDKHKHPDRYELALKYIPQKKLEKETKGDTVTKKVSPYAGFGPRLGAAFVDFLVFVPIMIIYFIALKIAFENSVPMPVFIFIYCIPGSLSLVYFIYFHGRWGKSIGKMSAGITVMTIKGKPISYKHALYRYSVNLGLVIMLMVSFSYTIYQIPPDTYLSGEGWISKMKHIKENKPQFLYYLDYLWQIWILIDPIVLLFNKKKRAIHDFIAGTAVIRDERIGEISNFSLQRML